MFDVMADWLAVPLLNSEAGNPPKRMALAHPSIAPYGVFQSKDGKGILISIQSEREWKKLCAEVLDQPDLPKDPRFASMVERVRNRALTDKAVGDSFATMARVDLLKRLADADIAFAEVNTMADLAVHPHLRRIEVDTPNGKVNYAAPAAIFVGEPRHYGAVPGIGDRPSNVPKLLASGPNHHDRSHRRKLDIDHLRGMDRTHHGGLRHRHRATGKRPARHPVPGDRRAEAGRCGAVDRALVPGAAGVSDVGTEPGRSPDARRLPAAGAAAAPDVGRRRTGIFRAAACRRRGEADLAHLGRDDEDRQHRRAVFCLGRAPDHHAARHRDPRAAGHRLSRHVDRRSRPRPPRRRRRRRSQSTAKATWPIPCCCFAIRR